MSDEYSVHSRFLAGKLDEAGYLAKMEYMRQQERLAEETEAYGAYLNRSYSPFDDPDEQALFDEDLLKARAAMEVAWLEQKKTIKP